MSNMLQRKVIGDLRFNRWQFVAVWLVVTLGTAFYGAMYPAGVNMQNSFFQTYDQLHYLDFQVQLPPTDPAAVDPAQKIAGVSAVEGRLVEEQGIQLDPSFNYLTSFRMISLPDGRDPQVNQLLITDGQKISAPDQILLLKSFADFHHLTPGKTIAVWINGKKQNLAIAGLVFSPEYIIAGRSQTAPFPSPSSFGVGWMQYSQLASLSGLDGKINDIAIRLDGTASEDRTALQTSVRQALDSLYGKTTGSAIFSRAQTPSGGVIQAHMSGNFPIMAFFSGVFLVGATLIVGILLARLVQSEYQRIGTLRALGVRRGEIVRHYLTFGLVIGLSGGIVGTIIGYINSFVVMYTFIQFMIGGTLPGFVNYPQIPYLLFGIFVVTGGAVLAGIYPAWAESTTPPGLALRPATPKSPSVLSRLSLQGLPLVLRQTLRNLLRVPGRSFSTAIGVFIGAAMIFSAFTLWDTLNYAYNDYFHSLNYDLRVVTSSLLPASSLEQSIKALPGVDSVQGAVIAPVSVVRADQSNFDTFVYSVDEHDPFLNLLTLEGAPAFSSADGLWIGNNLARVLNVNIGDTLTLSVAGQQRSAKVLGIVSQPIGAPVFVPRSLLVSWTPGNLVLVNAALVRAKPGQVNLARDGMITLQNIVSLEATPEYVNDLNRYLDFFRISTITFGFFGLILVLAVLFNTVNISLSERRDELAILRALGTRGRFIVTNVLLELLCMVLLGAVIGIPIGEKVGYALNDNYNTDVLGIPHHLSVSFYLIGLVGLIVIVLLSTLPSFRSLWRYNLGQLSKSQSL